LKNKIDIQILSPATREQLIAIRDELRGIEGFESFDLKLPPAPLTPGKMDGGLGIGLVILDAVISGITHVATEKTVSYYEEKIAGVSKRILGGGNKKIKTADQDEPMSATTDNGKWNIAISANRDGKKSITRFDESGSTDLFNSREYSIDPENTYAVLIGTSQYDDRANFSPIPPVAGNLDEMYRVLTDKTLVGLPFDHITRLYNESCINIKEELRNVSRTADIKTLIIYYSGHGQNIGNNQLSLIAKDTRTIDEELHNDIPYAFVEKMMNLSQADQKIVFIDACHSGLAAQGNNNSFDFDPVLGTFTLASTSADDSSYFKRDSVNTYFTGFLAEAFKKGIGGASTMLSLTDIYNYTSQQLTKMRLPAPVCKAQFKNILADHFFLSVNPSFSLEARLAVPKQLYQQGRIEEARREYILLEREYPDNQALRNEHLEFESNTEFNRLVREGDMLCYTEKNYRAAQLKYREALSVRHDENVRDKISDCEKDLKDQTDLQQMERTSIEELNRSKMQDQNKKIPPILTPSKKKPLINIRTGAIIVGLLSILYFFIARHKTENMRDADGNNFAYSGESKNDQPDGSGKAVYKNGNIYDGEWTDGKFDGKGTFTWANGEVYTGYFKNGYRNGNGRYNYQNGTVYDGYWVYGYWNGQGTTTWSNGDSYVGSFKDGYRDGMGTYTCSAGEIFNCPGCKKYQGTWRRNVKEGNGSCFDSQGNLFYTGYFSNDRPVNPVYPNR
jgi:hypothetical protein